jgi:hypothetical protein
VAKVHVINNSHTTIDFYVDGQWCGTLNDGQDAYQPVGEDRGHRTTLYAKGANGRQWNVPVDRDYGDYTWTVQ